MARPSKKKGPVTSKRHSAAMPAPERSGVMFIALPVLAALVAFAVYWPSLGSDFVYDAHYEMSGEGFITSLANLPDVLSLKVLSMHLILADRPGQLLFLMLNFAVWGNHPWGFHLVCNLLHAANVALLFVLLQRLAQAVLKDSFAPHRWQILAALSAVTLIFALHPVAAEAVSAVNYSSDLLVAFFAFVAMIAATFFRPDNSRTSWLAAGVGVASSFAAVTCKESGAAVFVLLAAYWLLFRREEKLAPWLGFLSGAAAVTIAFLAARFHFAGSMSNVPHYLGGSLPMVFLIQPRLWVFMLGKLIWPTHLSADYTLTNVDAISTAAAFAILAVVLLAQGWLAFRSRLGALGVVIFWAGLATVSNFMPLYRILADRFYYVPLAGIAMQLLALYFLLLESRRGFWLALAPVFVALVPFAMLTMQRESVFATEFALWNDTVQVSPDSVTAHSNLGKLLIDQGRTADAIAELEKALALDPNDADSHHNMGVALFATGDINGARAQHEQALDLNPEDASTLNDLGIAIFHDGDTEEAIADYRRALQIQPNFVEVHYDLGNALLETGDTAGAIAEYQKALALRPRLAPAECNLGTAYLRLGQRDEAAAHYRRALEIDPTNPDAQNDLPLALAHQQTASATAPRGR